MQRKLSQRFSGLLIVALLAVFLLLACARNNYPPEFVEFRKLPDEQQHARFWTFPVDRQIEYHLLSMRSEPPDMRFVEDIAGRGEDAVTPLLKHLKAATDDRPRLDLSQVFVAIHVRHLNLSRNVEVLNVMKETLSKIKDPEWRRQFQGDLTTIDDSSKGFGG